MRSVAGKVAVITGGANGIGRATGELLARNGAKVALVDIETDSLAEAAARLKAEGLDVIGVPTDITNWAPIEAMRDRVVGEWGTVNIAFLNAGVAGFGQGRMWEMELKDWAWGMAVNIWGVIHGIKALLPVMVADGGEGHCVITSSSVGVVAPTPNGGIYNMTKAANCNLAETLYGQLKNIGSAVSASVLVPPGTINTGLFTSNRNRHAEFQTDTSRLPQLTLTYEEMLERMNKSGNPRRPVQPEEVAEYVLEGILSDTFWIMPGPRHADVQVNFDDIIRARAKSLLERSDPLAYLQKPT